MFNCTEFAEGGFSYDEGYTQSDDGTCAMVGSNTSKNVLAILSLYWWGLLMLYSWNRGVIPDTK